MHAVRNIRLCTKDCLCLYVCPTGASDTENGQIDFSKCIEGCRACVDACVSHAISLVPEKFPEQQPTSEEMKTLLRRTALSKMRQEEAAAEVAKTAADPRLAKALAQSSRIMAEDLMREAGFMVPQNAQTKELLQSLIADAQGDFPKADAEKLLDLISR
jgi:Fe-S-cluster-containing hydrogenase component 2